MTAEGQVGHARQLQALAGVQVVVMRIPAHARDVADPRAVPCVMNLVVAAVVLTLLRGLSLPGDQVESPRCGVPSTR
jgi:hypothetical protein